MKRSLQNPLQLLLLAFAFAFLTACASMGGSDDPRQQAIDATNKAAITLDAAVTATRGAVRSGALKGADATNAVRAIDASLASIKAAQAAIAASPPASAPAAK